MAAADDAHLLERLLKGEQRAYKELVTTYQSAMRAVAYAIALASATAFAVSECIDWLVFSITKRPLHDLDLPHFA